MIASATAMTFRFQVMRKLDDQNAVRHRDSREHHDAHQRHYV